MIKANPFLLSAAWLLTLMTHIQQCVVAPDVEMLHNHVVLEVKLFRSRLQQLNYPKIIVDSACYCLCAAWDETVLATNWGGKSQWAQQSLLSLLCQETWGGERFYLILEVLLKNLRQNIPILEFIYVLLSLGFEGRYYGQNRVLRDQIRHHVFQKIKLVTGYSETVLSAYARDESFLRNHRLKQRRITQFFCACLFLFLGVTLYYNVCAYQQAQYAVSAASQVVN